MIRHQHVSEDFEPMFGASDIEHLDHRFHGPGMRQAGELLVTTESDKAGGAEIVVVFHVRHGDCFSLGIIPTVELWGTRLSLGIIPTVELWGTHLSLGITPTVELWGTRAYPRSTYTPT